MSSNFLCVKASDSSVNENGVLGRFLGSIESSDKIALARIFIFVW